MRRKVTIRRCDRRTLVWNWA